jgi:DNA-binding GntR family transcriptional regulator
MTKPATPKTAAKRPPSALQAELAWRIARLIRAGGFAPGAHLREETLAQKYDVSRTPVRMALKLLEEQGFVESRANSGVFVTDEAHRIKLETLSTATTTEDALYRAIISDRASNKLGATFSEAEIAAAHEAPKALLTRTLLRLNREGLIERRKGHGWSFSPMLDSREALSDSYRFRMLVEAGGLREPGFRVDMVELQKSREAHEQFVKQLGRGQVASEFFEMNAGFHEMLARFSRNRFIEQAVRQQNQLRRFDEYATFVNRSVNQMESCREHLEIMFALERDDRDWAAAQLRHHLSEASRL